MTNPLNVILARELEEYAPIPEDTAWSIVRSVRKRGLSECDWTVGNDTPLSDAALAAWRDYRQALRDITEAFQSPWDVTFPDAPA